MNTAGLIVKVRGELRFLEASVSIQILARPVITRVPKTAIGMTLFGGRVISVLELGDDPRQLVVADVSGEAVGLAGIEVIEAGFFEASEDAVFFDGKRVAPLDVKSELAQAESRLYAAQASSGASA